MYKSKVMSKNQFKGVDYYNIDELLSDEQKMVRDAARQWVSKEVSPIIEDHCQKAIFPKHLLKGLGRLVPLDPSFPKNMVEQA